MSPQSLLNESLLLISVILFKYLIKRSFVPKFIEARYYEAPRPASPACCCRTIVGFCCLQQIRFLRILGKYLQKGVPIMTHPLMESSTLTKQT